MEMRELTIDELNTVSGGTFVAGGTGTISFQVSSGAACVSWPGAVGGVNGTWTVSSENGVGWQAG